MSKTVTLAECAERLRSADDILILTHGRPDGDTIGSGAALCALLRRLGKAAYLCPNSDITPKLRPFTLDYLPPEDYEPGFVCAVDAADEHLLTADMCERFSGRVALCIDHHGTNSLYAEETCVDAGAAACAELIVALSKELGVPLTRDIALPAYLGLATDTGCFRYSSVRPATLRAAADALESGIDFYSVNRVFFETRSRAALAAESAVLAHTEFFRNGAVAVSRFSLEDADSTRADRDDTNNLSSVLRTIEGVELGVLLREEKDGWKVSARSAPGVDSAAVCARLGGGGHAAAAGATIHAGYEAAREALLRAISEELGEL